ncbi:MAG: 4a-hydroxytetrahydrobiopterin dehydratase [Bryobacteraceae bacterium]|jgi:4a-hydroxytetrahydrobiopterin dehydratase
MGYVKPRSLEATEIETALSKLKGWSGDQHGLKRKLIFGDFRGAMKFMQACIEGIEERDHHPAWCNTYNSVDIQLNTHDAGNRVTGKDLDLAEFIDSILSDGQQDFGYLRG